jgi:putative nucleotidyltransferase with HDIG domain
VLLRQITTQLQVDAAAVLLLNQSDNSLRFMAGRGFASEAIRASNIKIGEGFAGAAALSHKIVHIPVITAELNPSLHSSLLHNKENLNGYYGIPLIAKGQVEGVLELFERIPLKRDKEWLEFVEALAAQAAIAINNANLFQKLEKTNEHLVQAYDQTLEGWARALDYRDRETEGHSRRVTDGTLMLAKFMGLPEDKTLDIRRGALLHDIGKMAIPDAILLKAGPLEPKEWDIMRKHPDYSYDMLRQIDYLRHALDIPRSHHEKWDGSGYPKGIKGEEIPLAARIFTVVDVWDALRSDRPYRKGWTTERTLQYIRKQSGKAFDPAVVEAFTALLKEHPEALLSFK